MRGVKKLLKSFNQTKDRIGFTRFARIEKYVKNVEKHKLKNKRDIETVAEIRSLIDYRLNKVKRLYYLNILIYIAIYFSVFSIMLPSAFVHSEFGILISRLIGVFGTTLFAIGLFISNRVQELYYQDLNLLTAHFIAIYSRNESKGSILDGVSKAYLDFVTFFKDKTDKS